MRYWVLALALVACDDDSPRKPQPSPSWEVGPVIDGKNYSGGLRIDGHPEGWSFDFGPGTGPHYVTIAHGPLAGKNQMRMRYRVETDAVIHGKGCTEPSAVTLYFQRAGDTWSGKGAYEGYRWWATFASEPLSGAGEYEIVAPLDGNWTSVGTGTALTAPDRFAAAKLETGRVGFTFRNCTGQGHGATATGPVKFILTHFGVE